MLAIYYSASRPYSFYIIIVSWAVIYILLVCRYFKTASALCSTFKKNLRICYLDVNSTVYTTPRRKQPPSVMMAVAIAVRMVAESKDNPPVVIDEPVDPSQSFVFLSLIFKRRKEYNQTNMLFDRSWFQIVGKFIVMMWAFNGRRGGITRELCNRVYQSIITHY